MWFNELLGKYRSGISHTFLLHFNIRDTMDLNRNLDKYIYDEFIKVRGFAVVMFYDLAGGLTFLEPGMEREFTKITAGEAENLMHALPSKIFPYVDMVLKSTRAVLFMHHAEKILPSGDVGSMTLEERIALIWLSEWSVSTKISAVGSALLLTVDNQADISRELLRSSYRVEPIMVELPDESERKNYIEHLLSDGSATSDVPAELFAKLTSGLSRKSIKDIKLKAEAENVPVTMGFIKDKKHSVLSKEYGDVLEFLHPDIDFEAVGGMAEAKRWLVRNVVEPVKNGDTRRVPMGILLCGPSGTGKTLLVNALAKASGFNCVKIDMSRILGQYVGESEKNFKKCLLGAASQQPVIVFVDEIDQAFRRSEGQDSGVSRNIFSEFLQFTGNPEHRGRVIFVAATNRPDLLDPALKRAGRFDKKIPVLLPEKEERAEIIRIMIRRGGFDSDIQDFAPFAEKMEGYTGAEIEAVVRKAYEVASEDDIAGECISGEILGLAIRKCRPNTAQVEMMTRLAVDECDDDDLLPERYRFRGSMEIES